MSKAVCSQCGAPLTDESRFCSHCGAKVDDGIVRAEITINDKAKLKEVELQQRQFDAKGKLVNRIESLGNTYKNVSKTMTDNYKERTAAKRAIAEEKVRKAEAKAAEEKAKAEAKKAEAKIKSARETKILLFLFIASAAICFIYFIAFFAK